MNPHNGYIMAMVGGRGDDAFNRATQAERQPGSAMETICIFTAIQSGKTPGSIVDDALLHLSWSPKTMKWLCRHHYSYRYVLQIFS